MACSSSETNPFVKVTFEHFVKLYRIFKTVSLRREIVQYEKDGLSLELYRYKLVIYTWGEKDEPEENDSSQLYTHPDHNETSIEAYVDFMAEMQKATVTRDSYS